jgi:circadian clock protein KaiB
MTPSPRPTGGQRAVDVPPADGCYEFTLFVSGASDLSARAIANARLLCETRLSGRYRLSVVDVQQDSAAALRNGVLATPTLVKASPLPVRRFIGNLYDSDRVGRMLELPGRGAATAAGQQG